ncbi:GMC family oxidoreductase [Kitasatospora sp. NPDC056181]|uniref:GMC family oxidoreductase n=1 Tax=Kitasatospora sp. NPDC056181 TaxID=3345737 RepID=UPI0035D5888F
MTESVTTISADEAVRRRYDVVIVGGGWSGSLIARELGDLGWNVLILEAGNSGTETWPGYLGSLTTYHSAVAKVPNSAYRRNTAAPYPDVLDLAPVRDPKPGQPEFTANGYFVQNGRLPYGTDYLRELGGAAMHWLGAVPRMHPEDFATEGFGYGRSWPLGAEELQPWYARAELEIGVAGNADDQRAIGVVTSDDYVYPMHQIPASYIDEYCSGLNGTNILDEVTAETYELQVRSLPQARNSTPNPDYSPVPYRPESAVGLPNYGERCVGNASCVPICPVQAKSHPLRQQARFSKTVSLATRCVATRVRLAGATRGGRVSGVEFRTYTDPASPVGRSYVVQADMVVLAAHAIENARLLLFSGLANGSDQVGRNLMDHPTILNWALADERRGPVGPFRGPGHTSGWEAFRFGDGRAQRAPFRIEIGNWGWGWATGAPMSNVATSLGIGGDENGEVRPDGVFGPELRRLLGSTVGRQLQLQIAVEQSANPNNRVTIDRRYRDAMGNLRPVITYDLDRHTRDGLFAARKVAQRIFHSLGATDYTDHAPRDGVPPLGHFEHTLDGETLHLAYSGAGHGAGTHIMGGSAATSVVDEYQRTWEHPNLYAVGCGSMPSIGTSNPTITMLALALRSAEQIHQDLLLDRRPADLRGAEARRPAGGADESEVLT